MDSKHALPTQDGIGEVLRALLRPMIVEAVQAALDEHGEGAAPKPEILTAAQLCAALQISRATLHRLRGEGLPGEVRLGDSPRFVLTEVLAHLKQRGRNG